MYHSFQYKQKNVSYQLMGSGKAVVLLHGFGEDSTVFNQQIQCLQQHCLLILPDLPGSGLSAYNPQLNSIDAFAQCIQALLQHLHISYCTMLGHSMGGYITLSFAALYPTVLHQFGLIHSTAFADSVAKKLLRDKGIAFIKQHGAENFLKTTLPNLFGKKCKEEQPEIIAKLIQKSQQFSADVLIQYYTIMKHRNDRTEVLKKTTVPVLFIIGTEDYAVSFDESIQQTLFATNAVIQIMPNIGHMGMLEDATLINNSLKNFITE